MSEALAEVRAAEVRARDAYKLACEEHDRHLGAINQLNP
jgi:hypothetical protein